MEIATVNHHQHVHGVGVEFPEPLHCTDILRLYILESDVSDAMQDSQDQADLCEPAAKHILGLIIPLGTDAGSDLS